MTGRRNNLAGKVKGPNGQLSSVPAKRRAFQSNRAWTLLVLLAAYKRAVRRKEDEMNVNLTP